jgi:hypothetical protein
MKKQPVNQIKKILSISLVVLFVATVTAPAISAKISTHSMSRGPPSDVPGYSRDPTPGLPVYDHGPPPHIYFPEPQAGDGDPYLRPGAPRNYIWEPAAGDDYPYLSPGASRKYFLR